MCSGMTIKAFNFCFMLGPGFIYLFDKGKMAFFTVAFIKLCIKSGISILDVSH